VFSFFVYALLACVAIRAAAGWLLGRFTAVRRHASLGTYS
jgi:hypothetical protein